MDGSLRLKHLLSCIKTKSFHTVSSISVYQIIRLLDYQLFRFCLARLETICWLVKVYFSVLSELMCERERQFPLRLVTAIFV